MAYTPSHRRLSRKKYYDRKKNNQCTSCGKPNDNFKEILCSGCKARKRKSIAKRKTEKDKSYFEGKTRAYQTILGWIIDMRANRALMSEESTIITDKKFIEMMKRG